SGWASRRLSNAALPGEEKSLQLFLRGGNLSRWSRSRGPRGVHLGKIGEPTVPSTPGHPHHGERSLAGPGWATSSTSSARRRAASSLRKTGFPSGSRCRQGTKVPLEDQQSSSADP